MRLVYCSPGLVVTEARLARGARVPRHSHPSVQVTTVLRGRLRLVLHEEEARREIELGPGGYAVVGPGVAHEAEALEDSLVLDVNAPLTPYRVELAKRLWGIECPKERA
jgi:quercetin dioxygenase-like cupin family protein